MVTQLIFDKWMCLLGKKKQGHKEKSSKLLTLPFLKLIVSSV